MWWDFSSVAGGISGAVLGFVGGVVQQRTSREARFEKRIDKELNQLREEVQLCRSERSEFQVVKMGVSMLAAEVRDKEPNNATLKVVAAAFASLPQDREDFNALLAQVTRNDERKGSDEQDA